MMEDHHTGGEQRARPDLEHWNTLGIGTVFRDDMSFLSDRVELPKGFLEAFDGIPKEKEPTKEELALFIAYREYLRASHLEAIRQIEQYANGGAS